MILLASAWAQEQQGLDRETHAVLQVLAQSANGVECTAEQTRIAFVADVDLDSVEWHIATLVNAGLVVIEGGRIQLNLDLDMLRRHLRRNRRKLAPASPEAETQPEAVASARPLKDFVPKLARQPAGRARPEPAPSAPTRVFVAEGTPEWNAWMRARPTGAPITYSPADRARGWWFPSRWPAGATQQRQEERA